MACQLHQASHDGIHHMWAMDQGRAREDPHQQHWHDPGNIPNERDTPQLTSRRTRRQFQPLPAARLSPPKPAEPPAAPKDRNVRHGAEPYSKRPPTPYLSSWWHLSSSHTPGLLDPVPLSAGQEPAERGGIAVVKVEGLGGSCLAWLAPQLVILTKGVPSYPCPCPSQTCLPQSD